MPTLKLPARMANYLPLIVMALLAALTYWLLQTSLRPKNETAPVGVHHTPDQFADDMTITMLADTGVAQYRINSQSTLHYEDDLNTFLTNPAIRSFTPGQPIVTATAKTGVVNSDGTIINLYQNAKVIRAAAAKDPVMEADSEHFLVLTNDNVVKTELPVKLTRGPSVSTANGMIYTNTTRDVELLGNVRGKIASSEFNGGAHR